MLGLDPADGARELREQVGIVLQQCGVQNDLSVTELIEMYGRYHLRRRPVDEVIALVELTEKRDDSAKKLSGGQRTASRPRAGARRRSRPDLPRRAHDRL